MDEDQGARVVGLYTQPYNDIVRPEQVWKITKYFLRRWTPYLSPNEVWLVIGARQLSYFNEKRPWFRAYDATLAEAAGLHVKVFRRTIKKAIVAGEGHIANFLSKEADPTYRRKDGVTRQTQTQYTIRRDDPLTLGDADALAYWLRRHSPERITPDSVTTLLTEAISADTSELRASVPGPSEPAYPKESQLLHAASDVVSQVFPTVAKDKLWREAADALHTHIVRPELAHFETHYWRRRWLPELGAGPALLLTYLRSLCYHNETSGEIRDQIRLLSGELEAVFQVSSRTLRRWFAKLDEAVAEDDLLRPLFRVVQTAKQPDQKVATTYWINLKMPLTPEDLAAYRQRLLANGQMPGEATEEDLRREADKKFLTGKEGNGQKVPHREAGGGQKVAGSGTKEGHYKYYKILLEGIGLRDFEDLWSKGPEQQQHIWHVHDEMAGNSFAAVAAQGDLSILLDKLTIQEPTRGQIVQRRPSCEEVVAWYLYARQESGLEQPLSYVIRRLLAGDAPPLQFLQAASLSWEQWRAYAAVCYLWEWLDSATINAVNTWPLFSLWCELFGQEASADLPFGVGEGLEALHAVVVAAGDASATVVDGATEMGGSNEAAVCWQAALRELELQMTRATFDAWLRDAVLVERKGDTFVVGVRSEAAKEWLEHRMQGVIERTLSAVVGEEVKVHFAIFKR